jgi:glycerophosphoryl diester phosphodiesterase
VSDWKTPHATWIVGHRGAPRRARENTLDSLDWAESLGADAVEIDLRQTRDGEAVLFHDEDIVLGGQRVPVKSFTAREIEKLTLPSELGEYRIPRLEDVLHRYGHAMRYVIEVKTSASTQLALMARRVTMLARSFGVAARCFVVSFDGEFLRRMRETDPEIATGSTSITRSRSRRRASRRLSFRPWTGSARAGTSSTRPCSSRRRRPGSPCTSGPWTRSRRSSA